MGGIVFSGKWIRENPNSPTLFPSLLSSVHRALGGLSYSNIVPVNRYVYLFILCLYMHCLLLIIKLCTCISRLFHGERKFCYTFYICLRWEKNVFWKARQVEKEKAIKKIVKTYSGFNQLNADQGISWQNGSVGAELLFHYCAAERVSAIASLRFLQCPVMYRLSISVLSAVSYMMYMIVCAWSINTSIECLKLSSWSDLIVVHCVFISPRIDNIIACRRGTHLAI